MEILEIIEKVGLPGLVVIAVLFGGKSVWEFFTTVYWPSYQTRIDASTTREQDQWTWVVQEISNISAQMQRVIDRMDRLETYCIGDGDAVSSANGGKS